MPCVRVPTVYILASRPRGTLYIGVTSNLVKRVWQHREGLVRGFTRTYGIRRLVWYEQHSTMQHAISREKSLKQWSRAEKVALVIAANPGWDDRWKEITARSGG